MLVSFDESTSTFTFTIPSNSLIFKFSEEFNSDELALLTTPEFISKVSKTSGRQRQALWQIRTDNDPYSFITGSFNINDYFNDLSTLNKRLKSTYYENEWPIIEKFTEQLLGYYKNYFAVVETLAILFMEHASKIYEWKAASYNLGDNALDAYHRAPKLAQEEYILGSVKMFTPIHRANNNSLSDKFLWKYRLKAAPSSQTISVQDIFDNKNQDFWMWRSVAKNFLKLTLQSHSRININADNAIVLQLNYAKMWSSIRDIVKIPGAFPDGFALQLYRDAMSRIKKFYSEGTREMNEFSIGDPCAGWGNRMIASSMLARESEGKMNVDYTGVDPSFFDPSYAQDFNALLQVLYKLVENGTNMRSFNATLVAGCSETAETMQKLGRTQFHCVMTSPPYHQQEKYSTSTHYQAWNRYPEKQVFFREFLYKMFQNFFVRLHPNGCFYLNVPDSDDYREALTPFNAYQVGKYYFRPSVGGVHNSGKEAVYIFQYRERFTARVFADDIRLWPVTNVVVHKTNETKKPKDSAEKRVRVLSDSVAVTFFRSPGNSSAGEASRAPDYKGDIDEASLVPDYNMG